ncbi:MAG: HVO_A0114 family putative DNA-binding protein [bacterium]
MTKKLIISICSEAQAMGAFKAGFIQAMKTADGQDEYLYFTSPTQLFQKITPQRWELLAKLQQVGAVNTRELARLLKRDIHHVQDDVSVLVQEGIIIQEAQGVSIPFSEIHTDFTLKAKAA